MRSPGHLLLGILAIVTLTHALLWALLTPPWQTPDEPKHFEYARLLAQRGELFAFADPAEASDPELQQAILASMETHAYWWHGRAPAYDPNTPPQRFDEVFVLGQETALYRASPVYYAIVARLQRIPVAGAVSAETLLGGLYAGRLLSVLLAGLTVLLVGLASRSLAPEDPLVRYGAPAFLALHPGFAFAFAGVNSDVLVNVLAAGLFLVAARWLTRGPSWRAALATLVLLSLAIATKRTALTLLPLIAAAVALRPWVTATRPARVLALGAGALLAAIATLAAGLRLVWPDLSEATRFALLRYFFNEPDQPARILAVLRADETWPVLLGYAYDMHAGFWGRFGWQVIGWPGWLVGLLLLVAMIAVAGGVRILWLATRDHGSTASEQPQAQAAALLVCMIGVVGVVAAAVAFFASYLTLPYGVPPQGRYLYLMAGPIAVLLVSGLGAWLPRKSESRWRALVIGLGLMAAFDAAALLGLLLPWFYG